MARESRSRSPSLRRSRRSRRNRSRSPYSHNRRKSRSISPRRRKSHSRTPRRRRSRSATPRRFKRRQSTSSSVSPVRKSRSPSLGSVDDRNASEMMKQQEEERQRRQREAELKLIEEETNKRVEEAIKQKVAEVLDSMGIKAEVLKCLEEGRKKLKEEVAAQLEKEKEAAIVEAWQKEVCFCRKVATAHEYICSDGTSCLGCVIQCCNGVAMTKCANIDT